MITQLKGKVLDENGKTIPSATIFISDENGRLINEKARVRTDLNGEYVLPFSVPIPNFATGKIKHFPIGRYITVIFTGYPNRTVVLPSNLFSENVSGVGNLDIEMIIKEQTTPEVVITASRSKFLCEKNGGVWDETTKSCKLPKKNWWQKNKWFVIGGLVLTTAGITIYLIRKSKK